MWDNAHIRCSGAILSMITAASSRLNKDNRHTTLNGVESNGE